MIPLYSPDCWSNTWTVKGKISKGVEVYKSKLRLRSNCGQRLKIALHQQSQSNLKELEQFGCGNGNNPIMIHVKLTATSENNRHKLGFQKPSRLRGLISYVCWLLPLSSQSLKQFILISACQAVGILFGFICQMRAVAKKAKTTSFQIHIYCNIWST